MANQIQIKLVQQADFRFAADFGSAAIPVLITDEPPPLGGGQGPNPEQLLRVGGCMLLLVASVCLLLNALPKLPDGLPLRFGTGLVAGFFAGATSLGGMVASVMLFAVALPAKNLRATLFVLFFGSSLYSLLRGAWHGVVTADTFARATWLAAPLLLGIAVGSHGFKHVSEAGFRKAVLAVLSIAGIASVL